MNNMIRRTNITRRQALAGMAGFTIFGTGWCRSLFGQQKIRLAVVGVCGKGWSDWLAMYKTGLVEIVALCDADYRQVARAQHLTDTKPEAVGVKIDLSKIPFYSDFRRRVSAFDFPLLSIMGSANMALRCQYSCSAEGAYS